jgi:hypothetical protein
MNNFGYDPSQYGTAEEQAAALAAIEQERLSGQIAQAAPQSFPDETPTTPTRMKAIRNVLFAVALVAVAYFAISQIPTENKLDAAIRERAAAARQLATDTQTASGARQALEIATKAAHTADNAVRVSTARYERAYKAESCLVSGKSCK